MDKGPENGWKKAVELLSGIRAETEGKGTEANTAVDVRTRYLLGKTDSCTSTKTTRGSNNGTKKERFFFSRSSIACYISSHEKYFQMSVTHRNHVCVFPYAAVF